MYYSKHRVPEFLSLRWNRVAPFLPPQASVSPPTWVLGGSHTRLRGRVPNSDEGIDHSSTLYYNPSNEEIRRVPAPSLKSAWTTHCSGTVGTIERDVN
jgi:hypothetical protein